MSVTSAVRKELTALGKTTSPLGAAALLLAGRLDAAEDAGASLAAMSKELRTLLGELSRAVPAKTDPVDDLKQRRSRRLSA